MVTFLLRDNEGERCGEESQRTPVAGSKAGHQNQYTSTRGTVASCMCLFVCSHLCDSFAGDHAKTENSQAIHANLSQWKFTKFIFSDEHLTV